MGVPKAADLYSLEGRVALVTGASQGIGAAIALRFAEAGAAVAVHYRGNAEQAASVVELIERDGGRALAIAAELTDPAAVDKLVGQVHSQLGGLDALVNNAGTFPNSSLGDMTLDDWRNVLQANADTAFLCTRAAAERMTDGAAIVNLASIGALSPGPDHSHYNSAKAAVVMLTRSAAQELGPRGIRVNAVSPGVIGRPGIEEQWPEGVERWRSKAPLGRLGQPEDVADACLFLASDASRWISGHNLVVDGGVMAASIY